jgi:hypothetical protein
MVLVYKPTYLGVPAVAKVSAVAIIPTVFAVLFATGISTAFLLLLSPRLLLASLVWLTSLN